MKKKISIGPMSLLKVAFQILIKNPVIFFPFYCLAFIQLLIMEIIFFVPRYPLSGLFGPIVTKTAGPVFLHYPFNYLILSKWFHSLEVWIYIFISCIFYAAAVQVIFLINNDKEVDFKKVFKKVFSSYFHLVAAMILVVVLIKSIFFLYGALLKGVMLVHATAGIYLLAERILVTGAPLFQLFFASLVSALFAFVIPIIMIENKKIIPALVLNFKKYGHLWGVIFIVLLITEIPYLPVILIRSARIDELLPLKIPELSGIYLVLSTLLILLIDVFQYAAITLCYLFKKEE